MLANASAYLGHVSAGTCRDAGLKRPTFAAVAQAAKALALPASIATASRGYVVMHAAGPSPCQTLADVAACLLRIHHEAWRVSPAGKASAAARLRARAAKGKGPMAPHVAAALGCSPEAAAPEAAAPAPAPTLRSPAERVADEMLGALADLSAQWNEAPAAPAGPQLPAFVTYSQPQQQPQQAPAPAAPAPVVAPGPQARKTAPARLPADEQSLLARFGLSIDGLLTEGLSNAKLAKGAALAWPVILHHLPAKALAQAVAGAKPGPTAPRSRIEGLYELAERENVLSLALAHNGCPWASAGCAAGCLAWAGHGGMSATVAAARARRTLAYLADPVAYGRAVLWAIARAWGRAQAKGLPLAVRLRGTDDLAWHLQRVSVSPAEAQALARRYGLPVAPGRGQTLPEALSLAPAGSLHLYEYSKAPLHGPQGLQAQRSAGFDVTASLAADRPHGVLEAIRAVEAGFRLAVPVALPKGQPLPAVLIIERGPLAVDLACINGDSTDHRWADPSGPHDGCDGVAVILRTKQSRGRGPEADAFSLKPLLDQWQPLAGGGRAMLRSQRWGA